MLVQKEEEAVASAAKKSTIAFASAFVTSGIEEKSSGATSPRKALLQSARNAAATGISHCADAAKDLLVESNIKALLQK